MTSLIAFVLIAAPQKAEDPRHMAHAAYFAGSRTEDPTAPGGYGTSDRYPAPVPSQFARTSRLQAVLRQTAAGAELWIANGGGQDAWLPTADSNILGFLEAKDPQGVWRPIEYHWWYTCGNSYHRLSLPAGFGWRFDRPLPSAGEPTTIRWRTARQDRPLVSNEIPARIPASRYFLAPQDARDYEVKVQAGLPVMMHRRD